MDQRIMIRPTADAVQPRRKQLVFIVTKLGIEFLQQKYGGDFFLQNRAGKKLIRTLAQKIETVFFWILPPKADGSAAQIRRVPATRFDFLLEEPLHPLRVLGRAAPFQGSPNLRCDHRGCGFNSSRPSLSHCLWCYSTGDLSPTSAARARVRLIILS